MAKESRTARARAHWRAMVEQQTASGKSVRAFCRERGVGEHSFYVWRRRLAERTTGEPVRFALVERRGEAVEPLAPAGPEAIEVTLVSGERLRIPVTGAAAGAEVAATLHTVLTELRRAASSADRRV